MNKLLQCPRTEICYFYGLYVDHTKNENLGVIEVDSIENSDYYGCKAFNLVTKLRDGGKLPPAAVKRVEGVVDCLLINQANRSVVKHRSDF
jgi:hypothetical protein